MYDIDAYFTQRVVELVRRRGREIAPRMDAKEAAAIGYTQEEAAQQYVVQRLVAKLDTLLGEL